MTVILGSQVAPSLVENMKIAKVENRTIANQNLIKDAIVKYIKLEGKVPTSIEDLKTFILIQEQNENNLFNGNYTYELVKLPDGRYNGTLKIFTTINDESASKYFSNSLKFPNKPICTKSGSNYNCETFYQLDMDVFDVFAKLKEKEWFPRDYARYQTHAQGNGAARDVSVLLLVCPLLDVGLYHTRTGATCVRRNRPRICAVCGGGR